MEPARAVWMILTLTLVVERGWGACYNENHMKLCPSPFFARARNNERFTVTCSWGDLGILRMLQLGMQASNGNFVIKLIKNEPDIPLSRYKYVHPGSRHTFTETNTSLTMTLYSPTVWNLITKWSCRTQYRTSPNSQIRYHWQEAKAEVIAHPGDISLTPRPAKPGYNYSEIVGLKCNATSSLTVSGDKVLTYAFQYYYADRWVTVRSNDTFHTTGIVGDRVSSHSFFIYRSYTLRLRVASISGCSRLYRCVLSYQDRVFEEDAAELRVNVNVCSGTCLPATDNITCPTPPTYSLTTEQAEGAGGTRITTSDVSDNSYSEQQTAFGSLNKGLLMGAISASSVLAMALLLLVAVVCLRRRRKREREKMELRQSQIMLEQMENSSHLMPREPTGTNIYPSNAATGKYMTEPSNQGFQHSLLESDSYSFSAYTGSSTGTEFGETSVDTRGEVTSVADPYS